MKKHHVNIPRKKDDQGFILVLTLLCALILSSVMLSSMFVATKGQKLSKNFKESVQTLNAADGALKQARGAINAWLRTQQVGTGVISDFTTILTGSASAGKLVVPGNSTDWGNLPLFGNTVKITATNNENATKGESASSTTDTDRIIVIQAEAIGASRQRVRVKAYIQAPSDANTLGVPTLYAGATFCNDTLGRKQVVRVRNASTYNTYNHPTLPPFNCIGTACIISTTNAADPFNLPPGIMFNAAKQKVTVDADSSIDGKPNSILVASNSNNCDQLFSFASQMSNLSDALPNVNVIATETTGSSKLGTRTDPVIAILNGSATVGSGGVMRRKTVVDTNSKGSGIMLIQYESETYTRMVLATQKNFYYEGLVIVYGDEGAKIRLNGDDLIYGGVVLLSGSDDVSQTERFAIRDSSTVYYSKAAINQANLALGAAGVTEPVTTDNDPRNQTVTIAWFEDYSTF